MLTISDGNGRMNRRGFLTVGGLGLGGLSLSGLASARAASGGGVLSGKSVIYIFQQGGPSQLETFDPKMHAPEGVRTMTGSVQTSIPGVIFGEAMSQLAEIADKLTVVRSFQTNNGGHNIEPIVGPDSFETNIGVHFARIAGSTRPSSGMPTNAVIYPASVCDGVGRPQARGNLSATGEYGSAYAPFVPGAGGQLQKDMTVNLSRERLFNDRRALLDQIDRLNRSVDATGNIEAVDDMQKQAYDILLGGGVVDALDLSKEDPETVAMYDTSRYEHPDGWSKVNRGKRGYYTGHARSLGKLLLLARRLCEAGCGFVTVHAGYAGVWDMHADRNNLGMKDGMQAVGRTFDHAIAAFVKDVEDRGLSEDILLVATGEMGRTPRINRRGGRDHWSRLAPLLLYGGGLTGGQVIGQSTRDGGEPDTQNLTPQHLISTIMHTVFDVGQLRVTAGVPSQVATLSAAEPIPGLF